MPEEDIAVFVTFNLKLITMDLELILKLNNANEFILKKKSMILLLSRVKETLKKCNT